MAQTLDELKIKAYDLIKKLGKLQEESQVINQELQGINKEIEEHPEAKS